MTIIRSTGVSRSSATTASAVLGSAADRVERLVVLRQCRVVVAVAHRDPDHLADLGDSVISIVIWLARPMRHRFQG
jgi:hypothetical protein